MRLLIQSCETWQFLHVSPRNGDVTWTPSLLTAIRHGIVAEPDEAAQLIEDHAEVGGCIVVNLDAARS
ncbi:MAG: hypothetical protein J0M00_01555 [Burkholderiales bacterium]|nr:hypothetical protein [Burkholderiales bacterium]